MSLQKGRSPRLTSNHRVELFQDTQSDKLLPHYKMLTTMPDIPVKPKLFQFKIDHRKSALYELSSIELSQTQMINVDYDMGMPLDMINREVYALQPLGNGKGLEDERELNKQLEEMRLTLFDEQDRFILSDSNSYDTPMKPPKGGKDGGVMPQKLPAKYRCVDREQQWGQDMKDPLAVRQLSEITGADELIMTTEDKKEKESKRAKAIQQIEKRFETVRHIKEGIQKFSHNPNVVATKVFDFLPMIKLLPNNTAVIVCDDVIEQEGSDRTKTAENNDFMLYEFEEKPEEGQSKQIGDLQKSALYRFKSSAPVPDTILKSTLGKRRSVTQVATLYEHVRDYVLNKIEPMNQSSMPLQSNDFLIMAPNLSKDGNAIHYIPITSKFTLQKKRQGANQKKFDDVGNVIVYSGQTAQSIVLSSRGYTKKEVDSNNEILKNLNVRFSVTIMTPIIELD